MNRSLWISAIGMKNQNRITETIAHNLSNVNTTSYKSESVQMQDLFYQSMESAGAETSSESKPAGVELGSGSKVVAVVKNFSEGNLKSTGRQTDLAIAGDGFFEVALPDGTSSYTRDGAFSVSPNGDLVTANGYTVQNAPNVGTTATSITIAEDGTVTAVENGVPTNKGQISIVRFPNKEGLTPIGRNLYTETESSGAPVTSQPGLNGSGLIRQFHLEASNVEIVNEMVEMISSQRAYEVMSKSIKTSDEMLRTAVNLK